MDSSPKRFRNFKWAFSTLGCPELDLDSIFELAREFEMSAVELRATENRVDLPKLLEERFSTPESFASFIDDQKIEICSLDTSFKLLENDQESREQFLEFLPWADAVGTRILRVFDGGTVSDGLSDEGFSKACETIDWWVEEKGRGGWKADIGIETHDALVSQKSQRRLLESYPELRIIWDSHHTWKKSGDPIELSWQELNKNVCNIHVKDSISEPSARHPFTYIGLGEGEFPLDETLQLLKDQTYEGYVTIEWERMWHPYLPELKTALQQAKNMNWF